MICEKCNKRKAVVKLVKMIGTKKVNYLLCEKCALEVSEEIDDENLETAKVNSEEKDEFSLSKFLGGLFDYMNLEEELEEQSSICNICGTTYDEFKEFNKLGCSNCYDTFNIEIKSLLKDIYGDKHHKTDKDNYEEKVEELLSLAGLLEKYVELEEYEKAAEIRDKIKVIKESGCDDDRSS